VFLLFRLRRSIFACQTGFRGIYDPGFEARCCALDYCSIQVLVLYTTVNMQASRAMISLGFVVAVAFVVSRLVVTSMDIRCSLSPDPIIPSSPVLNQTQLKEAAALNPQ
jgi:hypothetical protein